MKDYVSDYICIRASHSNAKVSRMLPTYCSDGKAKNMNTRCRCCGILGEATVAVTRFTGSISFFCLRGAYAPRYWYVAPCGASIFPRPCGRVVEIRYLGIAVLRTASKFAFGNRNYSFRSIEIRRWRSKLSRSAAQ